MLPSSSAVNWASMFMGAGPELHGYTEWGSRTPELPSRVLSKDGIFPTVFGLLRESDAKAEIGCVCEWKGIRYVIDTLALSYDKHVAEASERTGCNSSLCSRLYQIGQTELVCGYL